MARLLLPEEQESLLTILRVIYGNDAQFIKNKNYFNEQTLLVTEEALQQLRLCNNQLSTLFSRLLGAGALYAKGWLREILKEVATSMSENNEIFNYIACRNVVAASYKMKILTTF